MRKRVWLAMNFVLLLSLAGVACGNQAADTTSTASSPPAPLTVTDKDSGNALELVQGQKLIVRLPSNPSTGYAWSVADVSNKVLTADGSPAFEQDPAGGGQPPVGAGGTEIWTFSSTSAGQQDLRLEYSRSWETGVAPAQSVSYRVTVR